MAHTASTPPQRQGLIPDLSVGTPSITQTNSQVGCSLRRWAGRRPYLYAFPVMFSSVGLFDEQVCKQVSKHRNWSSLLIVGKNSCKRPQIPGKGVCKVRRRLSRQVLQPFRAFGRSQRTIHAVDTRGQCVPALLDSSSAPPRLFSQESRSPLQWLQVSQPLPPVSTGLPV